MKLSSPDTLTQEIIQSGISTWNELTFFVQTLPYGRNENREDFTLVWKEKKGTCSSKHAFLKHIAVLNGMDTMKLILGMYKMNLGNTAGIGNVLEENNLPYMPEAHCYLKIEGKRFDFTNPTADISQLEDDIISEQEIQADDVAHKKVRIHQSFLKKWLEERNLEMNFDQLWAIREKCIQNLSN
ncbi:MAG: hypothetical protein ACPG5P_01665 [Saprospiraceae bacterium]